MEVPRNASPPRAALTSQGRSSVQKPSEMETRPPGASEQGRAYFDSFSNQGSSQLTTMATTCQSTAPYPIPNAPESRDLSAAVWLKVLSPASVPPPLLGDHTSASVCHGQRLPAAQSQVSSPRACLLVSAQNKSLRLPPQHTPAGRARRGRFPLLQAVSRHVRMHVQGWTTAPIPVYHRASQGRPAGMLARAAASQE